MSWIFGSGGSGSGGGGGGSNASVGPTGAPAPTSATEIGIIVAGNLVGVSVDNPIPVSGSFSGAVEISDGTHDMGAMADFGTSPGAVFAINANVSLFAGITGLTATGTSLDVNITGGGGGTQYTDETAETAGAFEITVAGMYNGTDVVGLRSDASNNLYVNLHTAIPAGSNLIGAIEVSDGTNALFTSSHPGYVQFGTAQHVIVDSGGGGTQYVDETAETAGAFAGTAALGYNGTEVVALRMDASNNLLTNLATALPAGSNLLGKVEVSDGTNVLFTASHPGAVSTAQATPTTSQLLQTVVSFNASGNNVVIAGVGGQTIRIFKMWIVFNGSCNFKFGDTTPQYFSGAAPTTQYGSFTFVLDGDPHYITAAGKGFTINTDQAVQVSGTIWYTQS